MKKQPSRILLFITDQQRADTFSCLDHPDIKTPNYDRLAEKGAVFTRAYCQYPLCVPARSNLWTGLPVHVLGCYNNEIPVPLQYRYLAEYFTDSNWYTSSVGRTHFIPARNPHGFQCTYNSDDGAPWIIAGKNDDGTFKLEAVDNSKWVFSNSYRNFLLEHPEEKNGGAAYFSPEYLMRGKDPLGENTVLTKWIVDTAIEELEKCSDIPTFMNIGDTRPHPQFNAPKGWDRMYDPLKVKMPEWCDEDYLTTPKQPENRRNEWRGSKQTRDMLTEENIRDVRAVYYGDISHIDYQVGRLMDYLIEKDLFDDTLLIVTSDHGETLGDHRLFSKMNMYEGSIKIPMFVSWPNGGIKGGTVINTPVALQDVFTTSMELIDHPLANQNEYIKYRHANLVDVAKGNAPYSDTVFVELAVHCDWSVAAIQEKYKYVFYTYEDGTWDEQFYDLEVDPGEKHNLCNDSNVDSKKQYYRKKIYEYLLDDTIVETRAIKCREILKSLIQ